MAFAFLTLLSGSCIQSLPVRHFAAGTRATLQQTGASNRLLYDVFTSRTFSSKPSHKTVGLLRRQHTSPCLRKSGLVSAQFRTFVTDTATPSAHGKRQLVFLGTPEVAAGVLEQLIAAANRAESSFEVAAVVTQPGRPKGRRSKEPTPSPVEEAAVRSGIAADRIMCPASAREEAFLEELRRLQPDLCVTAAYGNILPKAFLAIPRHGTLNIHPSLLPELRGAAPVQRAIEAGLPETGVSVAFTVRAMDAGPVLAQQVVQLDDELQAPQLLERLFSLGTRLLLDNLDAVWRGEAAAMAQPQEASQRAVTHAAKLSKQEGVLDFRQPARTCHNKVRAFAGWPGTTASFLIGEEPPAGDGSPCDSPGTHAEQELKIVRTRVAREGGGAGGNGGGEDVLRELVVQKGALLVPCGDGSLLEVLEVQPAGKKVMSAQAYANGLKGRRIFWKPLSQLSASMQQ